MSTQPDPLHDRITALADEWTEQARRARAGDYGSRVADEANTLDNAARRLRAVLAETATAQPEADAVERAARALDPGAFDPKSWCSPHFGQTLEAARAERQEYARDQARAVLAAAQPVDLARAWDEGHAAVREGDVCGDPSCCPAAAVNPYRAAQPVEPEPENVDLRAKHPSVTTWIVDPEPDERETDATPCCPATLERIDGHWLVEQHNHHTCAAGPDEGHEPGCGLVPLVDLRGLDGWDTLLAEVRPEATHTITAEQRDVLRERIADPAWRRESPAAQVEGILHALDLRVVDTPTQGGDDA